MPLSAQVFADEDASTHLVHVYSVQAHLSRGKLGQEHRVGEGNWPHGRQGGAAGEAQRQSQLPSSVLQARMSPPFHAPHPPRKENSATEHWSRRRDREGPALGKWLQQPVLLLGYQRVQGPFPREAASLQPQRTPPL